MVKKTKPAATVRWEQLYEAHRPAPKSKAGRRPKVNPVAVVAWRQTHKASIAETARHFDIDPKTVTTACRLYGEVVTKERKRWAMEQEVRAAEAAGREDALLAFRIRMRRAGLKI